jgi:OOP family OmpA-OmpF porin
MKVFLHSAMLVILGLVSGIVAANPNYVQDSGTSVVRTSSGECLRTGNWSMDNATAECDATKTASTTPPAAPVEIAAVEPVMRKIELKADALFAFDSASLTDNGRSQLNAVLDQLPDASTLQDKHITITGHTDRIGADSYNQKLSEQRAHAVRDYLVSRGLSQDIVDVKGLGSAQPVVSCGQERGNALIKCLAPNRRTTIEFSAMEVRKTDR